jgi:uncharacterized membrane protein
MAEDVPPPKPFSMSSAAADLAALQSRLNLIEMKLDDAELSAEARHRELLIAETQQRIDVRHWVIVIAIVVMIFMAGILTHAAHRYFWGPMIVIPQSVAIVMFLAPIVSITTVTIMLLIGAFRRFKDDDMDKVNVSSLAAEALSRSTSVS